MKKIFMLLVVLTLVSSLFLMQAPVVHADEVWVTVTLLDHNGVGLEGGLVTYRSSGGGSDITIGTTDPDGIVTASIPDWVTKVKMTWESRSEEQNLAGEAATFQTILAQVYFKTCTDDTPIEGVDINYKPLSNFWLFDTTDASGVAEKEIFAGQYSLQIPKYNWAKSEIVTNWNFNGINPYTFTTTKVSCSYPGAVQYKHPAYTGAWRTYTNPMELLAGTYTFRFKTGPGNNDWSAGTEIVVSGCSLEVTFNDVNQPPVANDQSVSTDEDTAKDITLTASDPDGDPLIYSIVDSPSHGSLTGTPPDLTYTPNLDYNGADSFTYKANDGTADSNVATVSITVNSVNNSPVADAGPDQADIEQTSYAGAEVTLDGSGSSDPDGDTLTYEWTWDGSSASGVGPTVTLPLGLTTVTLTVSDDEFSDTDTVGIAVVDTTPPVVDVTSPEDGKTYLNTEGPIPVEYTATDICDSDLTITMTLDGNPFTGDEITLCGKAAGEHTLVVTAADDSVNTGTDSATFNVVPQSLETFTIKHMSIQWARPGYGDGLTKTPFRSPAGLGYPKAVLWKTSMSRLL